MKRKWLLGLTALCMSVFATVGLVGCGESGESPSSGDGTNTEQGGGTTTPEKVSLGLQYAESTDGLYYIVTGIGDCKDTDIIIPSMYEGKPIKEIKNYAFTYCSNLTSVVIPDRVTSIGNWAFYDCDNLTSVVIGDSVETIGERAFWGCSNLTSVVIGDSVTSIGSFAFTFCYKLVEIYNKSSLNISVGSRDYGYVGYYAKEIYTAPYTSKLYTTDDGYIFYKDNEEVWLIGYTGSATDLTLPSNVTGIYQYAFYNCYKLTSVVIGDNVETIGEYAFGGCYKLVEVYNKSTLTITAGRNDYGWLGYYAKEVYTEPYTSKLSTTEDGYILYTDNEEVWLMGYTGSATDLTLPSNVTGIYQYAFWYCDNLTSVVIGDSVTSMGNYAFYDCDNLISVIISDRVETIGSDAFRDCDKLTNVVIGESVTSIGERAFGGCYKLTSVYYKGTESDWENIKIGSNNTYLSYAMIYYYSGNETNVPKDCGNY